jgi:hypothetical protein
VKAPLKGRLFVGGLVGRRVIFGAFEAVQFGDARCLAFPDAMGDAVFLILPAAEFAFDLDMSAALE